MRRFWIEPAKICALVAGLASSSARPAAALRDLGGHEAALPVDLPRAVADRA